MRAQALFLEILASMVVSGRQVYLDHDRPFRHFFFDVGFRAEGVQSFRNHQIAVDLGRSGQVNLGSRITRSRKYYWLLLLLICFSTIF